MNRSKIIKVRVTQGEHQHLKSLAGKGGVSALLRASALADTRCQELQIVAELARVRNLLAQIAQNSIRQPPLDQILIVSQLVTVERELSKLRRP